MSYMITLVDPEWGTGVSNPLVNHILRNTGTDPLDKQLDHLGPIALERGPYGVEY